MMQPRTLSCALKNRNNALKCTQNFTKSAKNAQSAIRAHQNKTKRALLCMFVNIVSLRSKRESSAQSAQSSQNAPGKYEIWDGCMLCQHYRGCCHSDAAKCLPIPRRFRRPLCRASHEVYRLLFFSFSAARPCLASEAESDRNYLSGPNMAQNHP